MIVDFANNCDFKNKFIFGLCLFSGTLYKPIGYIKRNCFFDCLLELLFQLLGCGVLTVGIWMHVNQAPYSVLLPNTSFLSATVLTICTGAILFVVGFCGCLGAILESQCVLIVVCSMLFFFSIMD